LFRVVLFNTCEFGLEVQSVPHLIEEESQEEISPVGVEFEPTRALNSDNVFAPLPAVGEDVSQRPTDKTSDI